MSYGAPKNTIRVQTAPELEDARFFQFPATLLNQNVVSIFEHRTFRGSVTPSALFVALAEVSNSDPRGLGPQGWTGLRVDLKKIPLQNPAVLSKNFPTDPESFAYPKPPNPQQFMVRNS